VSEKSGDTNDSLPDTEHNNVGNVHGAFA